MRAIFRPVLMDALLAALLVALAVDNVVRNSAGAVGWLAYPLAVLTARRSHCGSAPRW